MIEDEGQATDLDADGDDPAPWWSLRLMADSRALAVAALVLAAISLLGIEAGREIASAFEFSGHSGFHSLAIIDGIQAGVAVVAVGLGLSAIREEWYAEEASWAGWMARAAIVVGALAFAIDLVSVIFIVSMHIHAPTSDGSGLIQ